MRILFILIVLCFCSVTGYSQHTEGYIKYTAEVFVKDTTPETLQAARMLRGSKMEVYVDKNHYRLESNQGPFGVSTMICNLATGKTLVLTTTSMGKFAQIVDNPSSLKNPVPEVIPPAIKSKTRKILGFDCYPVRQVQNGKVKNFWCTDAIDFKVDGRSLMGEGLPGFPMVIEEEQAGFLFRFTASNFEKEISQPEKVFSLDVPEGFTLVPNR